MTKYRLTAKGLKLKGLARRLFNYGYTIMKIVGDDTLTEAEVARELKVSKKQAGEMLEGLRSLGLIRRMK